MSASNYEPINEQWAKVVIPPCSRIEAERASKRLVRHFGSVAQGGPLMQFPLKRVRVRACWVTSKTNAGIRKGWGRLAHDISHVLFEKRHPNFRAHGGGHAALEKEIADYILAAGWLQGSLKPKQRAKVDKKKQRYASICVRLKTWESKRKRAETAIRKLRLAKKNYEKRLTHVQKPVQLDGTTQTN